MVRALFSSTPSGRLVMPADCSAWNSAKPRMQAVSVTPIDQPVLKNT